MNSEARVHSRQSGASGAQSRALAARAVDDVLDRGRSLDVAIAAFGYGELPGKDRAFAQALAFGTLRRYHRYRLIIDAMLDRPLARRDHVVGALLAVGVYQLDATRQPDYAAVSATVDATELLQVHHSRGLINALLRRYIRERDSLTQAALATEQGRYCHPDWLIERIRDDWPDDWEQVLEAGNRPPPMWLRVNRMHNTVDDYSTRLDDALGDHGTRLDGFPDALRLARPVPVAELPGFTDGDVSVQDAAAQLAAELLDPGSGMRVLDACAAPGGKTTHLLERRADLGELVAVDVSAERLDRIDENLSRLGLTATLIAGDATTPADWWDGQPFDRILVDAPCSATGVIRRHPDIKFLRRESDIPELAAQQRRLLESLWPLLAPGGRLLYATCSVLKAENGDVIGRFLTGQPDARLCVGYPAAAPLRVSPDGLPGVQLLPGPEDIDGFYYALMERDHSKQPGRPDTTDGARSGE